MISYAVQQQMAAALATARDDAQRAMAAAPGAISTWWAGVIGADSTASAARNLALAAQRDAERFQAEFDRLIADPGAQDADGVLFIENVRSSVNGGSASRIVAEASEQLSPATAVVQTAEGTAHDIAAGASSALDFLKEWGPLLFGLAVVFLGLWLSRPLMKGRG